MARIPKPVPQVVPVENYLNGVAKSLVDRLYGPTGPAWGTRLTEIEDTVLAIRQHLSEQLLQQALQRQADRGLADRHRDRPRRRHGGRAAARTPPSRNRGRRRAGARAGMLLPPLSA